MKILRTVFYSVLFLAAVMIATSNSEVVQVVYLPALPFLPRPDGAAVGMPLFAVILGSILIGVLVGGLGALLENTRARVRVRSLERELDRVSSRTGGQVSRIRSSADLDPDDDEEAY
ncbi:MAG: LapA family protein [Deltaproteobacteria bacterium]|nr:LapA family protein [Deltaproteobacteria bacterium]